VLTARLGELKLEEPTGIQAVAVPKILEGGSVAVQSYTGSGKTLGACAYPARLGGLR
jgi:superfamily II DNA/RNA helicase